MAFCITNFPIFESLFYATPFKFLTSFSLLGINFLTFHSNSSYKSSIGEKLGDWGGRIIISNISLFCNSLKRFLLSFEENFGSLSSFKMNGSPIIGLPEGMA